MSKTTDDTDNKRSNGKWIITKDSAISIGVVMSMIAVAVWTTSNHESTKNIIQNLQKENANLCQKVSILEERVAQHEVKGINGLPHPESMIKAMEDFRVDLQKQLSDKWRKTDDYLFMKKFCETNQLKMPPHMSAEELSKMGG